MILTPAKDADAGLDVAEMEDNNSEGEHAMLALRALRIERRPRGGSGSQKNASGIQLLTYQYELYIPILVHTSIIFLPTICGNLSRPTLNP